MATLRTRSTEAVALRPRVSEQQPNLGMTLFPGKLLCLWSDFPYWDHSSSDVCKEARRM